jgi:hypothetical protein
MANLNNALTLFEGKVAESERIVSSVEALWQTAPIGSQIRQQINEGQLSALYEMAYLSLFGHWENFLEDCTIRMLAGQGSPSYTPVAVALPKLRTLTAARVRLFGTSRFLLWHDPLRSANRVAVHVSGSPVEAMLRTSNARLQSMAAVRHAIAHQSEDALVSFKVASRSMVGVEHRSPGEFLRAQDHSDPLNPTRWLRKLTDDMRVLANLAAS